MKFKKENQLKDIKFDNITHIRIIDESCDSDIQDYFRIIEKKFNKHKINYTVLYSHFKDVKYIKFLQFSMKENFDFASEILLETHHLETPKLYSFSDGLMIVRLMNVNDYIQNYPELNERA